MGTALRGRGTGVHSGPRGACGFGPAGLSAVQSAGPWIYGTPPPGTFVAYVIC